MSVQTTAKTSRPDPPRRTGTSAAARWRALRRRPLVTTLFPFAVVIAVWAVVAELGVFPSAFFVGPATVADSLLTSVQRGILPAYIVDSLTRLAVGTGVGLLVGVALGFLIGLNRHARRFSWPLLLFFQAIGDIAWLPIVIIWFGFSLTSVTVVIVYTVVFPLIISIVAGLDAIPTNLLRAASSLGASRWRMFWEVYVPGALPGLSSGVRTGLGYGWRALIAAEIIIGTSGVGFMMFDARRQGDVSHVFVGMAVLGVLWYMTDALVLAPLEKETVERWGLVEGIGR
ncbi:NitT/TauT family transport system permease protein/taurine transport system permease protein [Haloactinopolyspora alba]|uniref:NitT/TauT family transport system permease protein/taurine transport system permease protein n=1 Tax=Haloactinopolyspora alba TaxID=648780 RepID=A0A2P8E2E5_9ACTN|nr:ABC transporter permease [Haloactinopolyspora alba]PSL03639.1 NitT/TauT family transport system permease protein/taurine transport system permease protein [Haloactinopolyspora alba]